MATKTDNQPDQQPIYDDNKPSWRTNLGDDPEDKSNAPSATDENLPESHPSRSDNALDPKDLEQAEEDGAAPGGKPALSSGEQERFGDTIGRGFNPTDSLPGIAGAVSKLSGLLSGRRRKVAAGGIVGLIISLGFAFFSFSAFEAIHVRENMLGRSNKLVNAALENRRAQSFARQMRLLRKGDFRGKLNNSKLASKLQSKGFNIEFEADGRVKTLAYTAGDRSILFDFEEPDLRKATKAFFGDAEFGREISRQFDAATGVRAVTWKGRAARRLYGNMGIRLTDWLSGKKSVAEAKQSAEAAEDASGKRGALNEDPIIDADKNGEINGTETDGVVSDGWTDINATTEYANKINAGESADKALGTDANVADDISADPSKLSKILDKSLIPSNIRDFVSLLKEGYPTSSFKFTKVASSAARGINVAEVPRIACRIKGTLNFVGSIRNVYVSLQLAKFSVRFLTAADHQKAGLIKSDGLKLLMAYLHTPSPVTGKSYTQAGGFQNIVMSNASAAPSLANSSRYSTGRTNTGLLRIISNFVNGMPGLGDNTCRVASNGFVQLGGAAVGVVAAVFSGGSVTAGQIAGAMAIGFIEEIAFQIGTPIITRGLTNTVIDGFENGEQAGDALASGWGALRGMNAGANGLRPITKSKAESLAIEADRMYEYEQSKKSRFARYFDLSQSDSLITQMAFAMPKFSFTSPADLFNKSTGLLSFASPLYYSMPGTSKVSAAAEEECLGDEQIAHAQLKVDVFCNVEMADAPDLNTDETEAFMRAGGYIQADGQPIDRPGKDDPTDDFADYIKACHSGRPTVLYSALTPSDAEKGIVESNQNVCFESGENDKYLRFTDWFSWLVDSESLIEDINDEYDDEFVANAPAGDLGISADGFVFPLKTTKGTLIGDGWCHKSLTNCHHDYNAADIFAPTGTPVVAVRGGTVVKSDDNDSSKVGSRLQIKGDDGLLYYYAHMGDGTIKVKAGDTVTAGQEIGAVGTNADAVGTPRHLHFDALPANLFSFRPSCSGASCSSYPFVLVQPVLVSAFNNLPD